ncbi:hypothetical protein COCON_G00126730, partial [Conger conger]
LVHANEEGVSKTRRRRRAEEARACLSVRYQERSFAVVKRPEDYKKKKKKQPLKEQKRESFPLTICSCAWNSGLFPRLKNTRQLHTRYEELQTKKLDT